jgi:hypothetical protein
MATTTDRRLRVPDSVHSPARVPLVHARPGLHDPPKNRVGCRVIGETALAGWGGERGGLHYIADVNLEVAARARARAAPGPDPPPT